MARTRVASRAWQRQSATMLGLTGGRMDCDAHIAEGGHDLSAAAGADMGGILARCPARLGHCLVRTKRPVAGKP